MIAAALKQHLLPLVASVIGLKRLISATGEPLINVFYHTVSNEYLPHIHPLYTPKTAQAFEADLDFLLKHFQPITMEDVWRNAIKEKQITTPSFHLSFDDGLREVYDVAMPILQRKGIPATVFVNSDFVDNRALMFRYKAALIADKHPKMKAEVLGKSHLEEDDLDDLAKKAGIDFNAFLQTQQPYLTTEQLINWQKNGFSIGAHSKNHPHYSLLSEEEQIRQSIDSCEFVQQKFLEKQRYFAFPFSTEGVNDSFFDKTKNDIALTFGISGINALHNGRHIDRIDMETYAKNARQCVLRAYMTRWMKK
jgi:peptidoglycan/xylan/chitin deacetylase (PgdA/CDA1 family)